MFSKPILLVYLLNILFSLNATVALADDYQITVYSSSPGDLIQVKNCLDYSFCKNISTSFAGTKPDYRFHAFINVQTEAELTNALSACHLADQGLRISVNNLSSKMPVDMPPSSNTIDLRNNYPGIYMKHLSDEEKIAKNDLVQKHLDKKEYLEAANSIISEFGLPTSQYRIIYTGRIMGSAAAITDHNLKTIEISATNEPCIMIQIMRHELEHVTQINKADACAKSRSSHSLNDHIARERSAYLNDIANIPLYCSNAEISEQLQDAIYMSFLTHYAH